MKWLLDPRLIFFLLSAPVAVWLLVRYYFKAPHPKLRPKAGEMALLSLLAFLFCAGGSLLLGFIMADPDQFVLKDGDLPSFSLPGADGGSSASDILSGESRNPFRVEKVDPFKPKDE